MIKLLLATLTATALLAAPAQASTVEPIRYTQQDSVPDLVVLSPDAPEGAREAADVEWFSLRTQPNHAPKRIRLIFKVDEYSDVVGIEAGVLMRNSKGDIGQLFARVGGPYVMMRQEFTGDAFYCPNSSVEVKGDRIILNLTYFCLPFRTGSFSPYVYPLANDKTQTPLGADTLPETPVMNFKNNT